MRVIKENTPQYESFYETLPSFTKNAVTRDLTPVVSARGKNDFRNTRTETGSIAGLREVQAKFADSSDIIELDRTFAQYIRDTLKLGVSGLFLLDEKNTVIESVSNDAPIRTKAFLNSLLSSGVIREIVESGKHIIVPEDLLKNIKVEKVLYLIVPFGGGSRNRGCLVVKLNPDAGTDSDKISALQIGLEFISQKIELLDKQREVKKAYNDLQLFQSRLANDYKLAAIGELTTGILDDILSPLQVIMSYTDFLGKEDSAECRANLDTVNLQAKKISRVVNRLINFSKPVGGKLKIQPCDINDIIIEFYEVVISTLKNNKYECILDLDQNVPDILSHPNYLIQVLMNVFFLLKPAESKAGGVLLQSKFQDGRVYVKFFTTEYLSNLESGAVANTKDVDIRIVLNLVRQQEGEIIINSDKANGTIVTLSFPVKRKM